MKVDFCLIGITLLFSSIYMSIENRDTDHFKRFYNLLDAGQKNKYESIVKERLMIYLGGMILGSILSIFITINIRIHDTYFVKSLLFHI